MKISARKPSKQILFRHTYDDGTTVAILRGADGTGYDFVSLPPGEAPRTGRCFLSWPMTQDDVREFFNDNGLEWRNE